VGSVATAVLNSRNQFFSTGLSIAAHNISLIGGILAARVYPPLGILGPTLGVVGGALLQILILVPGLAGRGSHFQLVWNWRNPRLAEIVRLLIPNGLSVGINYSGFIVDTAFASQAAEIAGLPALYNAFLLVGLPIALLGQAIGQVAFPRLAAHASEGDWVKLRRSLLLSLASAIAMAIPALLALIYLGRPVIHILFERGKFGPAAGDLTYQVLTVYALGLPAYIATELVTRGLIALRDTRTPLMTNAFQLAGRAVLMALFIPRIGVIAVPAAFAITAALETITLSGVLLVKLQRRIAFLPLVS
jgi:putative peptidoglycan lipid II flippase